MSRLDLHQLTCDREEFCRALEAEGIPNRAGYIPRYAICPLFQKRQAYPGSHFPFDGGGVSYKPGLCPVAEEILVTAVQIPLNEFYSLEDIEDIIHAVAKVGACYAKSDE